ncbi:MAG: ABC transporter permease subunit [Planctomycetota bacterium]
MLAALAAPAIALFLLLRSAPLLEDGSLARLFGTEWFPGEGKFGLLPLVVGTAATAGLALLIAVPIGLASAIWVRFYAGERRARLAEMSLGVIAGMPSVVFGLFGTFWIVPALGASLASAALVLAMMVVPSFALFALAALRQVPDGLLRDGLALGLPQSRVIVHLALRTARPGLIGAATLALARALGEALAVEMVAGNVPNLPESLRSPVRTLTTTLVQEFEYAHGAHAGALHLVALGVVAMASFLVTLAFKLGHGQIHAAPEAA